MTLSYLWIQRTLPQDPQNEKKNVHQITSIFYILLSFGVILRCLWDLEAYIYKIYISSAEQCLLT